MCGRVPIFIEPRCLGFRPFVMTHLVLLFRPFVTRADHTPGEVCCPHTPAIVQLIQALLALNELDCIRALWKEIRVQSRKVFYAYKKGLRFI